MAARTHFKARLKALEAKVARSSSRPKSRRWKRRNWTTRSWGEIDTAHPGYLGSQDTFHVGTLKGVGRVYQQTYIDTYAKVAQAKPRYGLSP